ncbi:Uncharacterised protein [Vibrio cholerae]|nr:Uncharacterised protein [Vibrio cholerae]
MLNTPSVTTKLLLCSCSNWRRCSVSLCLKRFMVAGLNIPASIKEA